MEGQKVALHICFSSAMIVKYLVSRVKWSDPFAGTCQDTFAMSEDGQKLTQITEMVMDTGEICNYR